MPTIWVVAPSYCDVPAFEVVRKRTTEILADHRDLAGYRPRFVLIDDSAGLDPEVAGLDLRDDTRVLQVPFNLGHQRALVFGVRVLSPEMAADDVVVTLDSDGQDRPDDVPRLLAPILASAPDQRLVALARRTERPESLGFRLGYLVFRCVFRLLTGTVVRTGNFAAYRSIVARQVLQHPHFDLCYSSSFISLDGPLAFVPCARGERLAGQSRMNRTRLGIHAIRMLMPFLDRIAIRMLACFAALFGLSLGALVATFLIRSLTDRAIPGWATYTALGALIVSLVSLGNFVLLFATFAQSRSISLINLEQTVGHERT